MAKPPFFAALFLGSLLLTTVPLTGGCGSGGSGDAGTGGGGGGGGGGFGGGLGGGGGVGGGIGGGSGGGGGTAGPDAGVPDPDAGTVDPGDPDASAGDDAGVEGPGDPPPFLGLSWPASQVFPSFARVDALDVVPTDGLSVDEKLLLLSLQGVVNREQPRIYVAPQGRESNQLWLDELAVPTQTVTDLFALVTKYRDEVTGLVIYDDAQAHTKNLATTIAGMEDALVASPALAATLGAAPYSLPIVEDLRTHHFASTLEVYEYELDHYAATATDRMIIGLTPGIADYLRDYAVATRALVVWLDPENGPESELLGRFLDRLVTNAPYLGWWPHEGAGVEFASTYAVPTYAADFSSNLTVLGGSPRGSAPMPRAPARPPLENKAYVAIFMSDGDNLQEDQHLINLKWNRAHRGDVPIAWTISPALVDVAPVILRYFQRTATDRDLLVSGPSGLGYTYPAAWPDGVFEQYVVKSGEYMAAANLRIATLWNHGVDLSDADAQLYVDHVPNLVGLTVQDATQRLRMIGGSVPLQHLQVSYGDTAAILESGIDHELESFDGTAPLFIAVQGNMNMGTISPDAFYEVQQHYANDTDIAFVRADHFFQLIRASKHAQQHRVFEGDFTGDGKTDQLFYQRSDGHFFLGVSDGSTLTWHDAGDASGFGNLLADQHAIYTGDFDGNGKQDLLFYYGGNGDWFWGLSDGTTLAWSRAANIGTGVDLLDGRHRVSTGDYDGNGKDDVLYYGSADGKWHLGLSNGTALVFQDAGDSSGFGNLLDGSHVLYDGDFDGDGKQDVVFGYNGNGEWWMGLSDGDALTWHLADDTDNFGNVFDRSHRILDGDFDGDGKRDLLFYYGGNGQWWMGLSDGTDLTWHLAGTSGGMGDLLDLYHYLSVGDFDGNGKDDVMVYDSRTGEWWLGASDGASLAFGDVIDDTHGFGDLHDPSRLYFQGDYDGDGATDVLFYYDGDGNWWLRPSAGDPLEWHLASNTADRGKLTQ